MSIERGVLYVIATPIGNLEDMSPRAARVLAEVDLILAEDTRHSAVLLRHCAITTPTFSLHEHNESQRIETVLRRLRSGESLALISDAGTPLVSDPGYRLVKALHLERIKMVPIPGPSALTCALSVAGLPTDRFVFEGFLPSRSEARRGRLAELSSEARTVIFFEAPHRIEGLLSDLVEVFGQARPAVCARELTKVFESVYSSTLGGLRDWLAGNPNHRRGELVVLVGGAPPRTPEGVSAEEERILSILLESLPLRQAVELSARITGARKNVLYRFAIARGDRQ